MTTGTKLQNLRKEKNLTQEQLADMLNVSRQTIYKWESDMAYPETDKLIVLARLYKVSIEYLLMDEVERKAYLQDNCETKEKKKRNVPMTVFSIITLAVNVIVALLYIAPMIEEKIAYEGLPNAYSGDLYLRLNFYKLAFSVSNIFIGIMGIFSIVLVATNIGISITNICLCKKELCKANKCLNVSIFLVNLIIMSPLIKSALPCFWVIIVLLLALEICQNLIVSICNCDNEQKQIEKSSNVISTIFIHLNILLLFLTFTSFGNEWWYKKTTYDCDFYENIKYSMWTFFDILDRTYYFVAIYIIFIGSALLAATNLLVKNKYVSLLTRLFNVLAFSSIIIVTLIVNINHNMIFNCWYQYFICALFGALIICQYVFKGRIFKKHFTKNVENLVSIN